MFIVVNLLVAVAQVLDYILWAYAWVILARVVISFINADYNNPIVRFICAATEPIFVRVRMRIPAVVGGFDFSPFVILIAIVFLQRFVVRSLFDLARALG